MKAALPGWIGHLPLRAVVALALGLAVALPLPTAARADPGDLDPTFGNNGKVMTPLGQQPAWVLATAMQPDGKILAVGHSQVPSLYMTFNLVLARYNVDGSLDRSFGDGGLVTPDLGYDSASGTAIALLSDGRIVVAGWVKSFPASSDFALVRFNPDGTLDTTFGSSGVVTTDFSGGSDTGSALAIQTDGRIVVIGSSYDSSDYDSDTAIARYHPDGSLDTGFGEDGRVVVDLGSDDDYGNDVAMQTDGKIVIAGEADGDLALTRLLPAGALDVTFAGNGALTGNFGFSGNALEIQTDGKIVVVGTATSYYTGSDFALGRFNSDGSPDLTFGDQGFVITDFTPGEASDDDFGTDVIIQTDGCIIAAGNAETDTDRDFALARYHPDGSLDASFGTAGKLTTDFETRFDYGRTLAFQPDGKIIVAGNTASKDGTFSSDFALARYNADGSLDARFGAAGRVTNNFELGHSSPHGVAVQVDGKIVTAGSTYAGHRTGWDFVLVRYNPDASLDADFGRDGISTTDFGLGDDNTGELAIQRDGKIVVAGGAEVEGIERFALARYLHDGSPDPAFGNGGTVTTAFTGSSAAGSAITIQSDGKIVVAGNSSGFALARYNPDGSLDTGFGSSGTVTITLGSGSFSGAYDMALQSDGKIVVAGTHSLNFALARFNRDGSLDRTFGRDGTLITDFGGNDWCTGLAIQADGKLVAAGDTENGWDFALARYDPDGSLDPAFGTGGMVTTDLGSPVRGGDVAIQPGGKILIAGFVWPPLGEGGGDFALVRYQPDGAPDETFGSGGIVATDFAGGQDVGRAIALQPIGKIVVAGTTADTFALARYAGWEVFPTYLPVIAQATGQHLGLSR